MTNTRDKLNEAKHFIEEMKRVSLDSDKFRYELTAFLAAIRSVTQIMQKEFLEKMGFSNWYAQKQKDMANNPILKYLHRQRSITFHERPVLSYPIRVTDQISDGAGMRIFLTGTGSNNSLTSAHFSTPVTQSATSIKYFFDDIPGGEKDVITICQESMNALDAIVTECEANFS